MKKIYSLIAVAAALCASQSVKADPPAFEDVLGTYPTTYMYTYNYVADSELLDYPEEAYDAIDANNWLCWKWYDGYTLVIEKGETDNSVVLKNWFPPVWEGGLPFPDLHGTYDALTGVITVQPAEWIDAYSYEEEDLLGRPTGNIIEAEDLYTICKEHTKTTSNYHDGGLDPFSIKVSVADGKMTLRFDNIAFVDDEYYYEYLEGYNGKASKDFAGISSVVIDTDAPAEYYNLQGIRVASPARGTFYIVRQGDTITKVIM